MIKTPNRTRSTILTLIDAGLQAATAACLIAAIAALQADMPNALYLLVLPVAALAVWACSGLVIDRQTLRRG